MVKVVRLASYANKDSLAVLRALEEKILAGEVVGLALCYRTRQGAEECALTGHFARNPDRAAAAAMRLSLKVAQANGELLP